MAKSTSVNIKMIKNTVKVLTCGLMARNTLGDGKMGHKMEKESTLVKMAKKEKDSG